MHAANFIEQELSTVQRSAQPSELDLDYLAALGVRDRIDTWRAEGARLLGSLNGK